MSETLLTGENAAFLDQQYAAWLRDPGSVSPEWRALFESWEPPGNGRLPGTPDFPRRSIFNPMAASIDPAGPGALQAARRQARVVQLINAFRVRGHMAARIDPLEAREEVDHPELTLAFHGLDQGDLDAPVASSPLFGEPEISTLGTILKRLRAAYCGSIGAEFMNIQDIEQKQWVQRHLETLPDRRALDRDLELRVLRKLSDAENFERTLHNLFPGTKRFSLEGAETLIPLLDLLIAYAGRYGAREVVMGMAHRGRLNVLANTLEKPVRTIVREFRDVWGGFIQGSGDVKYHLGYSSDTITAFGDEMHLSLTPNPSHLEAVDPVLQGRVRAKQDRAGDDDRETTIPVLLHGDAAFAGQGLVAEVLNLSEVRGYRTGGTIHVIVNNQIGFTTAPTDSRSTPYATDIARMLAIPIFHVNGEDPRAVAATVQLAVQWRQRYKRDVVIDMYCYRKHGHNEGDEPSFTQPKLYAIIRSRPTPREVYASRMVKAGDLSQDEVDAVHRQSAEDMERAIEERATDAPESEAEVRALETKGEDPDRARYGAQAGGEGIPAERHEHDRKLITSPLKGLWTRYQGSIEDETDTGFDPDRLRELLVRANTIPQGFAAHAKVRRVMQQRLDMVRGKRPVDWAVGEQAAYATLVVSGLRVRLSGQDSARGTFSHRHAVLTDIESGEEYFPLSQLDADQAPFEVLDSTLSEAGVLGFEYGYSWDYPDALVLWEAQFGDFANGAQVIIDQFMAAAEQKWNRCSGLVMLLPHGYEGQGPEHSSARLERYLQLCAEENMQVANCTTPASFFHLLRRQVLRRVRKPLVVMTPKSLLRHADATCSIDDLAKGSFQRVIADPEVQADRVRRVVLCSGKVYYDLLDARRKGAGADVALCRVELLHPYPRAAIDALLARYPAEAEVVWCQEEPWNMGAWPVMHHWLEEHLGDRRVRYVGRKPAASPATGSTRTHVREQQALVQQALAD